MINRFRICLVAILTTLLVVVAAPGTALACTTAQGTAFDLDMLFDVGSDGLFFDEINVETQDGEPPQIKSVIRLTTYEVIPEVPDVWGETYMYGRSAFWSPDDSVVVEPLGRRNGPEDLQSEQECNYSQEAPRNVGGHIYELRFENAEGKWSGQTNNPASLEDHLDEIFGEMTALEQLEPEIGRGPADPDAASAEDVEQGSEDEGQAENSWTPTRVLVLLVPVFLLGVLLTVLGFLRRRP